MYAPRARVVATSYANQERKALILAKVSDVDAYSIRYSDGTRATVPASHLRSNEKTR